MAVERPIGGQGVAGSRAFEWVCEEVERATRLDRLEARGTVRIALRNAGLEAASVRPDQMSVVLERVLPGELSLRQVEDAAALCQRLAKAVVGIQAAEGSEESPEEVFRRLGDS
ncbi:MAG: hypothetical protein JRG86_22485 [Deltaproteobacteria bacterium]|nr:hypothetical protein [Deltaproteobacteria bacterium]MBW2498322.1 hypothetical protein [Deltaproteobacteria bacterium]